MGQFYFDEESIYEISKPLLNFEWTQGRKPIYLYYKFSLTKFATDNNSKTDTILFKKSPVNPLIILYQLTMFETPSCKSFLDIKFSMSRFAKGNN